MSADPSQEVDLSDEWIEREQPPTLKMQVHGSLSGSVNILGDTTQKWNNVNKMVSKDLLTKQTKPLTSLFEPPCTASHQEEGLSIVEEEHDEDELEFRQPQDYQDAWSDLALGSNLRGNGHEGNYRDDSDSATVRAGATVRSAEGLIPNFSFPRNNNVIVVQDENTKMRTQEGMQGQVGRTVSEPTTSSNASEKSRHTSNAKSEAHATSTPQKNTHKSTNSSISPTKSPLKLFHTEQDTFTRDHTARMIGMLSAPPAPTKEPLAFEELPETQIPQSQHSTLSEATDGGPNRKRVKTHEPKGSVTLQNFNDNADRLAAKLKAKSGGLGKGLPRVLEDTKVVRGRRISSAAERLDQQRKRERNLKLGTVPQTSGFEAMNIPIDQFSTKLGFGTKSSKSHFSDWDSEANPESRHVSSTTDATHGCEEAQVAEKTKPQTLYDSVRQTWTTTPGRIAGPEEPVNSRTRLSPQSHVRSQSNISVAESRQSPRLKNFPPAAMETLRHGNMIFSASTQCWRNVDEVDFEDDPFSDIEDLQSPKKMQKPVPSRHTTESQYPEELDFTSLSSTTASPLPIRRSFRDQQSMNAVPNKQDAACDVELPARNVNDNAYEETSILRHAQSPHLHGDDLVKVSQHDKDDRYYDRDLADMTADMTMSQSTAHLLSAINKRYGAGPWEEIRELDLSGLNLDSLCGLSEFFPELLTLNISNNNITSFDDLPASIQTLKAAHNKLTSHRTNLSHLPNIEHLDISNNRFEDIDGFTSLLHLRDLDVSNNDLYCLDGLRHLSNLTTLQASGNRLVEVDFSEIQNSHALSKLQVVNLSNNKLCSVMHIDTLSGLVELDISGNVLDVLEAAEAMPQLRVLKACDNALTSFSMIPFTKLRVLYLDDNELKSLVMPRILKHIETFSIRRQSSSGLQLNLDSLCEVRKLFIGGNTLPDLKLETVFHSLKYLELAGMQLKTLPANLAQAAPNLRVLNASNNDISDIEVVAKLVRLERLMLPNNKIDSIENLAQVLVSLPRLKAVDLRANPYTSRFYASIHANLDIDYFANLDGMRNASSIMAKWIQEDEKYQATLHGSMKTRRAAYQNLIWTICRALRWHDGRMLEPQQLLQADEYVHSFSQDNLVTLS